MEVLTPMLTHVPPAGEQQLDTKVREGVVGWVESWDRHWYCWLLLSGASGPVTCLKTRRVRYRYYDIVRSHAVVYSLPWWL